SPARRARAHDRRGLPDRERRGAEAGPPPRGDLPIDDRGRPGPGGPTRHPAADGRVRSVRFRPAPRAGLHLRRALAGRGGVRRPPASRRAGDHAHVERGQRDPRPDRERQPRAAPHRRAPRVEPPANDAAVLARRPRERHADGELQRPAEYHGALPRRRADRLPLGPRRERDHAHRALHGVQPDRARDHDRGRAAGAARVGTEVPATSDVLTPETPEAPELQPEDSERAFVRRTAAMSVGTALSRLTGFLRVSATAFALGVAQTRLATSYTIANNTPNIVYELVLGGVLTSVFVPVFVQWLEERGREDAWDVARSVLTIAVVALSAITVVTVLAAPWIVRLYMVGAAGPGVGAARAFATFCLRLFMPQIVFYGIGAVATGLLNAHRRFAAPMFAPILNNLIVIGTMLAFVAIGQGD